MTKRFARVVMGVILFGFLGTVLGSRAWAASQMIPRYRLGVQECIRLALLQNQEIKAAGHDIDVILAKKIEATKRYIPVVKYQYRTGPVPRDLDNPTQSFFGGDISILNAFKVELGVPLYTFGRIATAKTLADLGVDLKTLQKKQKQDEVALNIYKLYQGILLARELKVLIHEGLGAINNKIGELEKEETTDQLQILKMKVILYEAERKLQEALSKEVIALATLKVLMGLEDDVDFDLRDRALTQDPVAVGDFERILIQSKQYRPEYQLLIKGLQAQENKIKLEKKEYLPNIGVGAFGELGLTPGIIGDEDDNSFNNPFNYKRAGIGFEVSGTLDVRKTKARVSEAQAEYMKILAQKRAANRGLELDLKKAFLDFKQYQFLLSRSESDKRAVRQIVFLTKSNLDLGLGEKKDYLDALQTYLLFQGRAYEAIFNYNSAVATLKQKMGILYPQQSVERN